jgi:hypothetical protein
MTMGVMRRMVVTLSRTADTMAVIKQRIVRRGQTLPLDILKAHRPIQLKTPVSESIETIIIILKSRVLCGNFQLVFMKNEKYTKRRTLYLKALH